MSGCHVKLKVIVASLSARGNRAPAAMAAASAAAELPSSAPPNFASPVTDLSCLLASTKMLPV